MFTSHKTRSLSSLVALCDAHYTPHNKIVEFERWLCFFQILTTSGTENVIVCLRWGVLTWGRGWVSTELLVLRQLLYCETSRFK